MDQQTISVIRQIRSMSETASYEQIETVWQANLEAIDAALDRGEDRPEHGLTNEAGWRLQNAMWALDEGEPWRVPQVVPLYIREAKRAVRRLRLPA